MASTGRMQQEHTRKLCAAGRRPLPVPLGAAAGGSGGPVQVFWGGFFAHFAAHIQPLQQDLPSAKWGLTTYGGVVDQRLALGDFKL